MEGYGGQQQKQFFLKYLVVSVQTVYVKDPVVPLPASLTAETPQPAIRSADLRASLDLNVSLLSALGQCKHRQGINKIEAYRLNNRRL